MFNMTLLVWSYVEENERVFIWVLVPFGSLELLGKKLLDLQLPMQSVPITTDVASSNSDQGEVYNNMLVIDLRQGGCFLRVLRFPPPIKPNATI